MLEQIVLEGEGSNQPHSFGGYTIIHRLDRMEPESFVNTSREGRISYYNQKRGFGFCETGKESYFLHFRGYAQLKHVFYENTHRILFLVRSECDSNIPKLDHPIRYILKKTPDSPQGAVARLWVPLEEYDSLVQEIKIEGHEYYKVSIARKTVDEKRMDILVIFNGNNLDQLRERLLFLKQEIAVPSTELYCEKLIDGCYHEAEVPV